MIDAFGEGCIDSVNPENKYSVTNPVVNAPLVMDQRRAYFIAAVVVNVPGAGYPDLN